MAFLFSLYSTNTKVLSHDTIQNLSNFRHFSPCSRGGSDFIPRLKPGNQFLFQSTLPRRERRIHVDADIAPTSFQSTLPHGERHRHRWDGQMASDFNPRSRMGSDGNFQPLIASSNYFNPRSRMGSDGGTKMVGYPKTLFQSTLPHGERQYRPDFLHSSSEFQSTLPRRERR